jgi:hypothetical protein
MSAETPAAMALLRKQVADLLSQIDTATLPAPDAIHGRGHVRPGAEWKPGERWRVFTIDTADGQGAVYVDHVCDSIAYRFGAAGDWESLRPEVARRIGLAFLAAAHRADQVFSGVSRLDVRRDHGPVRE